MTNSLIEHEVAIIGMGVYTPLGCNCEEMKKSLRTSKDSISKVSTFNTNRFFGNLASTFGDNFIANRPEEYLDWMDRGTLFAIHAYKEALQQSGINFSTIDPNRIGVCLGSSRCGLVKIEGIVKNVLDNRLDQMNPKAIATALVSHCTSVIKRMSGARGPIMTVSSACASSNAAIGIAADWIRKGKSDIVIAGGSDTVSMSVMSGFNALRAISPHKAAPFSDPVGLNLGEGAGIVILVRSDFHLLVNTPIATILGYALSGDAYHATSPDAEGKGAMQAMLAALKDSGIEASDIDYINAHGTGTEANDSAESKAVKKLFGTDTPISSTKSFMGHTLGASGVLELISTLLLANDGVVPHGLRISKVRQNCENLDYVRNQPRKGTYNAVMVNNFGFGGNNSSLVVCPANSKLSGSTVVARHADIVVTGLGVMSAAGEGFKAFEQALIIGQELAKKNVESGIRIANCPKLLFSDTQLSSFARCAPATKYSLAALKEALASDHGIYNHNSRSGLVSGMICSAQKPTEKFMTSVFAADPALASAYFFPMTLMNSTGGACSLAFGVTGYNATICGSAAGLAYAADLARYNRQNRMIVVSSDEFTPQLAKIFYQAGVVKNEHKRGVGRAHALGEFGSAFCLERADEAAKRKVQPLARLVGWSHRQDSLDLAVARSGASLTSAIQDALDMASIGPRDINVLSLLNQGLAPIRTACQRAITQTFGKQIPATIYPAQVFGYAPSASAMMTVLAAFSGLNKYNNGYALAAGYDLIGDGFAFIISTK